MASVTYLTVGVAWQLGVLFLLMWAPAKGPHRLLVAFLRVLLPVLPHPHCFAALILHGAWNIFKLL